VVAVVIAGPVVPRNALGIGALLGDHPDLLEHGLRAAAVQVELPQVATVSLLARDAAGAPVLVFVEDAADPVPAAVRACRAHAHLAGNPWLLQRLFPHRLPAPAPECLRVMIAALRYEDLALATLRAVALPDVSVFEIHEWIADGRREWYARPLLVRPQREDAGFTAPSATPPALLGLARELMGWIEKLDADVTVDGDRYVRRVAARGASLCRLAVDGADLTLTTAGGPTVVLATRADAVAAMDAVMAGFERVLLGAGPAAKPDAAVVAPAPAAAPAESPPDLEAWRRSVAEVHLTRAECNALQVGEATS
jgi:hypothetical protein